MTGRDKTIAEAEAKLNLQQAHVTIGEDDPAWMEKKKAYCATLGKVCDKNCDNTACKNHPGFAEQKVEVH
ncbi:MAG: hypothetical protein WC529_08820 [Candidatus Margulisiibacteriota bacterium]